MKESQQINVLYSDNKESNWLMWNISSGYANLNQPLRKKVKKKKRLTIIIHE